MTMLDENQRKAIFLPFGESAIVEAPPGHGKTFVMARRIEFLIESGYIKSPKKILGLTFTNAAAGEMLDDIKSTVSVNFLDMIQVMTFHSLCYKILRAYGNLIGVDRNFQIISELDQAGYLQQAADQLGLPLDKREFSNWRNEAHRKDNPKYTSQYSDIASRIYGKYINDLGNAKIDYDNLLLKTIELFETFPIVLGVYQSVFRYILVDEFQDTNPLQFKFLLLLVFGSSLSKTEGGVTTPVFILADEAQAIYRFQAATPENIEKAKKEFSCTEIKLDVNHRSNSESVLNLTQAMRDDGVRALPAKTELVISANPSEEAVIVIGRIRAYQGSLHDIGVIAQNQYVLEVIRDSLDRERIPYIFIPDFSARAIESKHNEIFSAVRLFPTEINFNGKISTRIRQVCSQNEIVEDDVLKALINLASNFDSKERMLPFKERALKFYNDIFVQLNWGNLLRKTVRDKVFLSTIHGVKGLQFAHVHILGLSNFEHIYSRDCYACSFGRNIETIRFSVDDSIKTLYVASTRAKDALYLYSTRQNSRGARRNVVCILAQYIDYLNILGEAQFCGN